MANWELLAEELGTTGVHGTLLPDGNVLYFSYDPLDENNVNRSKWQIWNEESGPQSPAAHVIGRNLFCAGHCWLGDGRILVSGGQSWNYVSSGTGADHDIHTFDVKAKSWTRFSSMQAGRYYPTSVTLADGNGLIMSGAWTRVPVNHINHEAEIFDWRTNTLSARIPFNPGFITEMYPFAQLLPDGSSQGLLWVHANEKSRLFSLATKNWLNKTFSTKNKGNRNYPTQGAAVLLPLRHSELFRAKVLLVGGGSENEKATGTAQIFEFEPEAPTHSEYRNPKGSQINFRRFMSDAVLLADGTVLICGGAGGGSADESHDPVFECEIFDPEKETFTVDKKIKRKRMYHSTALLLPSGRVVLTGNTEHWNPANPVEDSSLELYTPEYLLKGPQPRLTKAPEKIAYDSLIDLESPDAADIKKVAFVRCGSTTHTNNMDQRWVEVDIDSRTDARVTVKVPAERPVCPPGYYMIFLLNKKNIPSVAKITFVDPSLREENRLQVHNSWITVTVKETDSEVDTGIDLRPDDEFEIEANGSIWAGVILTGHNGPEGWNNVDHNPKFPLHTGTNAHPYSLIARFGNKDWFYVGKQFGPHRYDETSARRLFLRTNDDKPGNGEGQFNCIIRVWRNRNSAKIEIENVVANPPGSDVAPGEGEYVTLHNHGDLEVDLRGWWLSDLAGHKIAIKRQTIIKPDAKIKVYTARGNDSPDSYFAGRRQAVWNNDGDSITLHSADNRVVSKLNY